MPYTPQKGEQATYGKRLLSRAEITFRQCLFEMKPFENIGYFYERLIANVVILMYSHEVQ